MMMADYYPLIARAVAGLGKNTGDARQALYERARAALAAQLRGVNPALSQSEIDRERLALENAIRKVEAQFTPPRASEPKPLPEQSPAFLQAAEADAMDSEVQETKITQPVNFLVENVYFRFAPLLVQVGDLLFTADHCHFIPYTKFIASGIGIAAAVGGFAGGAAASLTEKNNRDAAVAQAAVFRKRQWGMTLSQRMRVNTDAISISRNTLIECNIKHDVVILRNRQLSYEYASPGFSEQKRNLERWSEGLLDVSQACVITSKYLAPFNVIELLRNGNENSELLDDLNKEQSELSHTERMDYIEYTARLWEAYETLPNRQKRTVASAIGRSRGSLAKSFAEFRSVSVENGKRALIQGVSALAVLAIGIGYIAIHLINDPNGETSFLGLLVFISLGPLLIFGLKRLGDWYKAV